MPKPNKDIKKLLKKYNKKPLYILDYYPYGKKTVYYHDIFGPCELKKVYRDKQYDDLSSTDICLKIYKEISRAMAYFASDTCWDSELQWTDAFRLQKLFSQGETELDKKCVNELSKEELLKLIDIEKKKSTKYFDDRTIFVSSIPEKYEFVKKNGLYKINRLPLLTYSDKKCLYTRQEIMAIYMLVTLRFENLC